MVCLLGACEAQPTPSADGAPAVEPSAPASAAHMAGELHIGGRRVRVTPFVFHPYEMDLRVRGLIDRDRARKEGHPAGDLVFEEARRSSAPTEFRVEYKMGLRVSDAMKLLALRGEAAHFLIEATGSLYQVLDTEHAARRGGEIRPSEVRILSGNTGGTHTLIRALKTHYGDLPMNQVEISAPQAPAPGGGIPTPPPAPAAGGSPTPPGSTP